MDAAETTRKLTRLIVLSIVAAILTIALKTTAWLVTGSVGLLSDAAESVVNLVAAVIAFGAIRWAAQPPDEEHAYGHEKADYLSAGIEGALIVVAAVTIAIAAIERLANPQPIEGAAVGLIVNGVATVINLAVATVLIRAGREHRSLTLEADGRHLMADVWTSVGVIAGVAAVALTGAEVIDPLIALVVAGNIVLTGAAMIRRSTGGLMDRALEPGELARIEVVLDEFSSRDVVRFHALRSRRAGRRAFVSVHVLVPGDWSVRAGHDLVERLEDRIREELGHASVFTHLEPLEDPRSFADAKLDR
ncbi:cation transporter [Thermoleophilia bacterium SCSIO 60948]|nr:cation transporter [Thermoleophilia bacterium SCSIO 60948]